MKRFILYNSYSDRIWKYDTFAEAERSLIERCMSNSNNPSNFFIGRLTYTGERKDNHTEIVIIDQATKLSGYVPQEGDVFVKIKRFDNAPNPYSIEFERKIIKVNPDTIVVVNKGDVLNPQVLPTKQWMKWIRGAEFIKKAGEDL